MDQYYNLIEDPPSGKDPKYADWKAENALFYLINKLRNADYFYNRMRR